VSRFLTSAEAARRLGVKVQTLYSYVSRGLVQSHPGPGGRSSVFLLEDVERLAGRGRRERPGALRVATVTTSITRLGPRGPLYRGHEAVDLARTAAFEQVAELLWAVRPGALAALPSWEGPREPVAPPRRARSGDLLRLALLADAMGRPGRFDRRPEAVAEAGRRAIVAAAHALPVIARRPARLRLPGPGAVASSVAEGLSARLVGAPGSGLVRAVNAAMVLLADHEMSTAALAARVATSTGADLCNVLLAGLGALSGPLHGSASARVHALLARARHDGAEEAIEQSLRWQDQVPGFGHLVYDSGDPRCCVLLEEAEKVAPGARWRTVEDVLVAAERARLPRPNVDFALAALGFGAGMAPEAGEVIMSVSRLAGLVAHSLEEARERPLRFRVRAVYSAQ
jgi:citrate synthase